MACLIGASERSGNHVTKFRNVAYVDASYSWVQRESPTRGSARLFLRTKNAGKVLIVERRDDERVIRKPSFFHYPVDFGLAGEMGNMKLGAANRFHIRQRGPDEVLDAGILCGTYRSRCLLQFVRSVLLEVGYQKYAMRPFKCWLESFGAIQVSFNNFLGEFAMLGRIASQGANLELIAGSKGAYYGASLLPRCADHGDELLICEFHVQCASLSISIDAKSIDIDTFLWTSVI